MSVVSRDVRREWQPATESAVLVSVVLVSSQDLSTATESKQAGTSHSACA